jgi:hypothetical protein
MPAPPHPGLGAKREQFVKPVRRDRRDEHEGAVV